MFMDESVYLVHLVLVEAAVPLHDLHVSDGEGVPAIGSDHQLEGVFLPIDGFLSYRSLQINDYQVINMLRC
jgi:hypothetical protein